MPSISHEPRSTSDDLSLLLPERQGYGLDAAPAAGARALAGLFPAGTFLEIDAPDDESLSVEDGVIGLSSIAGRFCRTLDAIRARRPARIFTVGGTCGVELAPVAYLNSHYRGDLGLVWLDAHGDLNTPESSPSGRFHGMVLRTLLGAGPDVLVRLLPRPLAHEQVVLAGARDLDRDEAAFVSNTAVSLLAPADLRVPGRVAGRIRAGGFTRIYVHLDLDVLDPAQFPDSRVHPLGGVSEDEVVETIQALSNAFDVVGFSVIEFQPRSADALARVGRLLDRCGIAIGPLCRLGPPAGR